MSPDQRLLAESLLRETLKRLMSECGMDSVVLVALPEGSRKPLIALDARKEWTGCPACLMADCAKLAHKQVYEQEQLEKMLELMAQGQVQVVKLDVAELARKAEDSEEFAQALASLIEAHLEASSEEDEPLSKHDGTIH